MVQIKELTKDNVERVIGRAIRDAIDRVADELGMEASRVRGRFTENNIKYSFELSVTNEDGNAMTREAEDFKHNAQYYGLLADDLFAEFTDRGNNFKIIGLNSRAKKYPIVAENIVGKRFKFTAEAVCRKLGRPDPMANVTPVIVDNLLKPKN